MDTTDVATFVFYGLGALLSIGFGAMYLTRLEFMPYHQEAVGLPWGQLDGRMQAVLLGFMRVAGGGFMVAGITLAILLIIPFRAGEAWARYAIPVVGLLEAVPALYATVLIRNRTDANTPVGASAVAVGLMVLGIFFSLV